MTLPPSSYPGSLVEPPEQLPPADHHGHNTIQLDSSITFEDYYWHAQRAREAEKHIPADAGLSGLIQRVFGTSKKGAEVETQTEATVVTAERSNKLNDEAEDSLVEDTGARARAIGGVADQASLKAEGRDACGGRDIGLLVDQTEWETAQRAARTASRGAVFYLITTDVLGPFNIPWAVAQLGYGPGTAILLLFGIFAYYSAMQLWTIFTGLDSARYPIRSYGDLAFRLLGNWARIIVTLLQSFQLFLNVVLCIVSNGQGLAQMAAGANGTGFLCFVAAQVIFTAAGLILGQIRSLRRLAWLANLSVWLNVVVILSTMAAVHTYAPNIAANTQLGITGPIQMSAGSPPGETLQDNINGAMNGLFAYGGPTVFMEFMAEMRRPMDFWKAIIVAEAFISGAYLIFGLVVYSQQGQYTFNPAFQGIASTGYTLQTLGNALYLITSLIVGVLFGNIGFKVIYASILQDVFKFPALDSKRGRWAQHSYLLNNPRLD